MRLNQEEDLEVALQAGSITGTCEVHLKGIDVAVVDPFLLDGDGLEFFATSRKGAGKKMRILLSFEKKYHVYGQAMAAALQQFRPDIEVAVVDVEDLEEEAERFDPQLVICSPPVPENQLDDRLALIELSPEPEQPSRFRVGERRREITNPTLGEILRVVDETKRLRREAREQEEPDDA